MTKEIVPKGLQKETSDILDDTLTALIEGLTGIAASRREELALSVGHIFQGLRKGQFLTILSREWNQYKEKGKIRDDYQFSEQHKACLQELLDFLDKDLPDEITFSLLKKIFLVAATEKVSDRESLLPQQYLKICRKLSSAAILILIATYNIANNKEMTAKYRELTSAREWLSIIANESGLVYPEIVEIYEDELIKNNLLIPRIHDDKSGVVLRGLFRLKDLGLAICQYMENYENI